MKTPLGLPKNSNDRKAPGKKRKPDHQGMNVDGQVQAKKEGQIRPKFTIDTSDFTCGIDPTKNDCGDAIEY